MIKDRIDEKIKNMVEKISYNTSTGSFAKDIVSSVAIELVDEENDFEKRLNSKFLPFATGENLDIACADKYIYRKEATYASGEVTITGVNESLIKKGYRVIDSTTNVEYEILEDKTIKNFSTIVKVKCLSKGIVGNADIGVINKFAEIYTGLTGVTNEKQLLNGKEIESDSELKERAENLIQKPRISWNRYVFEDTAREVEEVDRAYCVSRPRGAGSVDIIITQKQRDSVEEELKTKVLKYIDYQIISDIDIRVIGAEIEFLDIAITGEMSSDFDVESAGIKLKELINEFLFEQLFEEKISYFKLVEIIQHSGCFEHLESVTLNGAKEDFIADITKSYRVESISMQIN